MFDWAQNLPNPLSVWEDSVLMEQKDYIHIVILTIWLWQVKDKTDHIIHKITSVFAYGTYFIFKIIIQEIKYKISPLVYNASIMILQALCICQHINSMCIFNNFLAPPTNVFWLSRLDQFGHMIAAQKMHGYDDQSYTLSKNPTLAASLLNDGCQWPYFLSRTMFATAKYDIHH